MYKRLLVLHLLGEKTWTPPGHCAPPPLCTSYPPRLLLAGFNNLPSSFITRSFLGGVSPLLLPPSSPDRGLQGGTTETPNDRPASRQRRTGLGGPPPWNLEPGDVDNRPRQSQSSLLLSLSLCSTSRPVSNLNS